MASNEYRRLKAELYQSFVSSNSRGFTDQQVALARRCVSTARKVLQLSGEETYEAVPFVTILRDNELNYTKINVALNLVLQYITNLLADDLPPNWWSISTKTAAYAFRLARVKGAEDLLRLAGYTKKSGDYLSFPEDKRRIDASYRGHLSRLATEVLVARVDCEGIVDKHWEPPSEISGTSSSSYAAPPQSLSRNRGPQSDYTPPSYGGHNRPPTGGTGSSSYAPPALPPSYGGRDRPPPGGTSSSSYTPPSLAPSYGGHDDLPSIDQTPRRRNQEQPDDYNRYSSNNEPPSRDTYNPPLRPSEGFGRDPKTEAREFTYSNDNRGSEYNSRRSNYDNRGSEHDNRGSNYDNRGSGYGGSDYNNRRPEDGIWVSEYDHRRSGYDSKGYGNNDDSREQDRRGHSNNRGNYPQPSDENRPQPAPRLPRQLPPPQLKPNLDVTSSTGFNPINLTETERPTLAWQTDPHSRQRPEPPSVNRDQFSGSRVREDPPTHPSPESSEYEAPPQRKSEEQQMRPPSSHSRTSGELSGGSHHSSPSDSGLQSSNNSGSQTFGLGTDPSPDDPVSYRRKKMTQILEMAKKIGKDDPLAPAVAPGIHTTPQPPTQYSSLATSSRGSSFDSERPPPIKPRIPKASTSATPVAPPSRMEGGFGLQHKMLPGLSEEEYATCPKCNSILKDGVCRYCAGRRTPPVEPLPRSKPLSGSDLPPPSSSSQPPCVPDGAPQPGAAAALPPAFESKEQQLKEGGAMFMEKNRDKNHAEIQHFKSLSLPEQQKFLDDKVKHKESYGHLKPHWHGRTPYKEIQQEVQWFENLSGIQQQAFIQDRLEYGLDVSRFQRSLKPEVSLAMQDNQNAFEEPVSLVETEAKRERIRRDGEHFVHWLKECGRYGFHPKEVEIALAKNPENPLAYLQNQWCRKIVHFIEQVDLYVDAKNGNRNYGRPTENEARLCLIEGKGDIERSSKLCIRNRKEKIKQLRDKINDRFSMSWDGMVMALCQCNLVVDDAFYFLQRDVLGGLYAYLTTDYSEITEGVAEMEFLKKTLVNRMDKMGDDEEKTQACTRMIMAECKFRTIKKAQILMQLMKDRNDYPLKYYIDASNNYNTYEEAQKFLNQSCPICIMDYPMDDMVVMPACGEAICKECFTFHFNLVISEQSVKHFTCPLCDQPDLSNPDQTQTMNLELFVGMIKAHLEEKTYQLCQQKLTDFNLSKEEGFVWCPSCTSGFINENKDRYDIQCVHCRARMCFQCKRPWEDQHKGLTCEQFARWKADNDPEAQKAGLAAHLNENGIQCPQCKFRYALARGGCMHFRCTQCPNEFCSGCGGSMKLGDKCGRFESCKKMGLHAHHPRDCLFYLRDFSVPQLQQILTNNNVEFDTEPSKNQIEATRNRLKEEQNEDQPAQEQIVLENIEGEEPVAEQPQDEAKLPEDIKLMCCVMLQKELPEGLKDEECGEDAIKGMAGLCQVHYKEYLVSKINKNAVDPIELYELHQIKRILEREEMEVPPQNEDEDETDDDYKIRLIEHVKKELLLDR